MATQSRTRLSNPRWIRWTLKAARRVSLDAARHRSPQRNRQKGKRNACIRMQMRLRALLLTLIPLPLASRVSRLACDLHFSHLSAYTCACTRMLLPHIARPYSRNANGCSLVAHQTCPHLSRSNLIAFRFRRGTNAPLEPLPRHYRAAPGNFFPPPWHRTSIRSVDGLVGDVAGMR